jgi:hypothetical protein
LNYLVKNNNNKSITNLSARLDKLTSESDEESKSDGNNFWKGKKIIPLNEWRKIARINYAFGHGIEHLRIKEALEYYPDDYSQHLFLLGVPDNVRDAAEKWLSDYIDLMEFKKNANYGKTKCFGCLLSPCREEAAIYLGINKVIARELERSEHNNNISPSQPIYPCPVFNIFECPCKSKGKREESEKANGNGKGKDDDDDNKKEHLNFDIDYLFEMSEVAFQLELAFAKAQSMTESNNTVYEANFETNRVEQIRDSYSYGWAIPPLDYPLEEKLAEVKRLSVVPIRGAQDAYHALTDKGTLDKILKQGLDKENQKNKDQLLSFFMSIKDKVRIDDLFYVPSNYHSTTTDSKVQRRYASCSLCGEFANIHCRNCIHNSTWLCVDHWQDHRSEHTSISKTSLEPDH